MLGKEDRHHIYQQAYLPEHLTDYVESVSGAKPHLIDNHICFCLRHHMIFVGFALGDPPVDSVQAYLAACERYKPATVAIIAPKIWLPDDACEKRPLDYYYRLDLPLDAVHGPVAYMVRRAQKDLGIAHGKFGREHKRIVKEFLNSRPLAPDQVRLFKRLRHYLKHSHSAVMLEARKGEELIAFTVADLGSADFAFYLFNFRSVKFNIPGASDLLFHEMVNIAQTSGKEAINLGLGINAGIRRFKEKWGGVPFLPCETAVVQRERGALDLERLAQKL